MFCVLQHLSIETRVHFARLRSLRCDLGEVNSIEDWFGFDPRQIGAEANLILSERIRVEGTSVRMLSDRTIKYLVKLSLFFAHLRRN